MMAKEHEAGPVIKDWDAIDLLAYGSKYEQDICPLCGGFKGRGLVCYPCRQAFGDEGTTLVKVEIGRRNLVLWPKFVGENLSLLCRNGNSSRCNVVAVCKKETEQISVRKEVVKVAKQEVEEPETAPEPPAPVCGQADQHEEQQEDRTEEIMPGMHVWVSVAKQMAFGIPFERRTCPVCKGPKEISWWMCGECLGKFGSTGLFALKAHLSKMNPRITVYPPGSHIPKFQEREMLIRKAYAMLAPHLQDHVSQRAGELSYTLRTLKGVNRSIPRAILVDIAKEAIELRERNRQEQQALQLVLDFVDTSGIFNPERIAEGLLREQRVEIGYDTLLAAAKKFLSGPDEKRNAATQEKKVAITQPALDGLKNLRDDPQIAYAFQAFLIDAHSNWKQRQKAKKLRSTLARFLEKINYNIASWHYFKKDPVKAGISRKKAEQIACNLQLSLDEAIIIGQALLEGMN